MTPSQARKRYTRIVKVPGGYTTFFSVGGETIQEWQVVCSEDRKRAAWHAKMLGIAIARLVNREIEAAKGGK